jgi:hypothetical protein
MFATIEKTGQTPIVRPPLYNAYGLDNFPNGMNAVVAIISYTGYDIDPFGCGTTCCRYGGQSRCLVYPWFVCSFDTGTCYVEIGCSRG